MISVGFDGMLNPNTSGQFYQFQVPNVTKSFNRGTPYTVMN